MEDSQNKGKLIDNQINKQPPQFIKFDLNQRHLACFKGEPPKQPSTCQIHTSREAKTMLIQKGQSFPTKFIPISATQPLRERRRIASFQNNFNERVVFMHYDDIDVYIDNSTKKKTHSNKSKSSSRKSKLSEISSENELVSSCVRVITEETDFTSSNGYSYTGTMGYRYLTPPRNQAYEQTGNYNNYYYPRGRTINRNRRSVTMQQSRALKIIQDHIEVDGRTTIMVKNIPNKYTQDYLLEEFSTRCSGNIDKFDFFYLPIDKNNQCNLGYAFVNFISPKFIKQFYQEFHQKKWKRYKSPKTCELSYAVCQGTLALANHFKHTKTLQQKDKRLRPLIGTNLVGRIKQIVECQRTKE